MNHRQQRRLCCFCCCGVGVGVIDLALLQAADRCQSDSPPVCDRPTESGRFQGSAASAEMPEHTTQLPALGRSPVKEGGAREPPRPSPAFIKAPFIYLEMNEMGIGCWGGHFQI